MHVVNRPLLIALCLGIATAASGASERVPKPKLRPAQPEVTKASAIPIPRLRPRAEPADEAPAPVPKPAPAKPEAAEPSPESGSEAGGGWPESEVVAGRATCAKLLDGLDISYREVAPIGRQGGCGAPAPVEISAVAGVKLEPPATETCAMAAALVDWIKNDVQPAARRHLGTEVTEIRTATSYACRRRNNSSSGKMSEHSKANALDMSGFSFAKKTDVTVGGKGNWGQGLLGAIGLTTGGSFLEEVRKAACSHFTTVLGPGSDPYHGDHFHVDVLQRKGGYRICQ